MEDNQQAMVRDILELLKKNPNALSSVLQTVQSSQALANTQVDESNANTRTSANSAATSSSDSSSQNLDQDPAKDEADAEDLLSKRGKNGGTKAQQTFRFVLRESAKQCGMWEKPPLLRNITSKTLDNFTKKVTTALPQLDGYVHVIRRRLSEALINRRNQLNNTIYWQRAQKLGKYKARACQRPVVPQSQDDEQKETNTTLVAVEKAIQELEEDEDEETGFSFNSSEELFVMDGACKVARATFLRISKSDSDFAKLVLQSFLKTSRTSTEQNVIKLTGPNTQKFLHDITVGEKFYFPVNQLLKKGADMPCDPAENCKENKTSESKQTNQKKTTLKNDQVKQLAPKKITGKHSDQKNVDVVSVHNQEPKAVESVDQEWEPPSKKAKKSDEVARKALKVKQVKQLPPKKVNHSDKNVVAARKQEPKAIENYKGNKIFCDDLVAVAYNTAFYVGKVLSIDFSRKKVKINFMVRSKNAYYSWSKRRQDVEEVDVNFIFYTNIIFVETGHEGGGFIDGEEELVEMFEQYKFDFM